MKSAVFGLDGEILAEATIDNPVAIIEVDFAERKLWSWVGDLKNRIFREMPPKEATNNSVLNHD